MIVMPSGTLDLNLKIQADFSSSALVDLQKPKNYYSSLLPSTKIYRLYLHLNVLGAVHVRVDHFTNFGTFYPLSSKIPVTVSL